MTIRLYDYWRSWAARRVRIALNLKALAYERIDTSLLDAVYPEPALFPADPVDRADDCG